MILAQAVVEPPVGGSSILVEFIIAVTPLVLGILTVLVKQFAATKALKKSEERTKLAFAVVDDFYGGDNWELFKWWMELEEIIGKGVVEGWKEINRVIEKMEK